MSRLRQIAIALPMTGGFHEEILLGIEEFARRHGSWSLGVGPDMLTMSLLELKGWPGDGVIAEAATRQEIRAAHGLSMSVVNVSGVLGNSGLPTVINDHRAIGRLAAEHLLGCELQSFGYYGLKNVWYSQERRHGFQEVLAAKGYSCAVLETPAALVGKGRAWHHWLNDVSEWLKNSLTLPCGVMAVHDPRGRMVIEACRQLGLNVPQDVAVIGVGNYRIACEASRPTLSSIARNGWEVGYRAAELLDRLMSDTVAAANVPLIPPDGIIPRESTDTVAIGDPDLNHAVAYIREHLAEPLSVKRLLKAVPVSRRWLEYRFRERFGLSPYEYICRMRVERAKQMLANPEKPGTREIALACGFSESRVLRIVFQRVTGSTMKAYRAAHGAG